MADTKLSDLTALTAVAAGDLFYVVDISDTTDDAAGSSKKITLEKVLTTPTVTGVLKVLQSGGTPGTDEVQLYHDGTDAFIITQSGVLRLAISGGFSLCQVTSGGSFSATNIYVGTDASAYPSSATRSFGFLVASSAGFGFSSGSDANGPIDTWASRIAAGVLGMVEPSSSGGSGKYWLQNTAGVAILDANFTSTSTTMANTNLTCTVISGRSYAFRLLLPIDNATAGDGFKCDFDGSTATMTRFLACAKSAGTITEGVVTSAALATDFTFTSATSTAFVIIEGSFKASGNGTFKLRAAKNSDAAGATMTLLAGARMELSDMVAV